MTNELMFGGIKVGDLLTERDGPRIFVGLVSSVDPKKDSMGICWVAEDGLIYNSGYNNKHVSLFLSMNLWKRYNIEEPQ